MKLAFLRPLYDSFGDQVSVYLDVSRAREDAAQAIALRWRAASERLADAGADAATLDAVADAVTDPANAAPGVAVFARHGTVRLRAPLRDAPRSEIARMAALPHVMPMLAQRPLQVPHLRVTADREGGEVLAITGTGRVRTEWAARQGWPVHKTPGGGWAQDHHQRNVERTWDDNAKELAGHTEEAARQVHAEHIVIGGDVRARTLLLDHLSTPLRQAAVVVGEEVPADAKALADAAEKIISDYAERTCRERFGQWHGELTRARAVAGLADTVAALRDGRAAEVFIADDPSSTAQAWVGPGGTDLALTAEALTERGVTSPARDRADAAIARAIACTDAELFLLPEDLPAPRDGIGATLRYPEGGRT
jgi:hypothetical protein